MNKQFLMGYLRAPFDDDAAAFGASAVDTDPADDDYSDDYGSDDGDYGDDSQTPSAHPQQAQEPTIPLSAFMQMQQQLLQPQQQQQQPAQLTQEELDKKLKVFRPSADHVRRLFNADSPEEQVAVLNEMFSAQAEHLTTVMGYYQQMLADSFHQQYSPALEMVNEQKMSRFVGGIVQQYPALKGRDPLIRQAISLLKANGYQPSSGEEAARQIAGQVEALIRSVDPQFSLAAQRPQQRQQTNMPAMAPLGGGSGGRATGGQRNGGSKNSWDGVFD